MNPVSSEGMTFVTCIPGVDDFGEHVPYLDDAIFMDADNSYYSCHTWRLEPDVLVYPLSFGPREFFPTPPEFWYDVASWFPEEWDDFSYHFRISSTGAVSFRGTADTQYGGALHEGLCLHGPSPYRDDIYGHHSYLAVYQGAHGWISDTPR